MPVVWGTKSRDRQNDAVRHGSADHARQAGSGRAAPRFPGDLRRLRPGPGGGAGGALRAVRHPFLSGALPAAQQHPRLAADDRRRPSRGSLRAGRGDQQHARGVRPHLPAGPAVRGQLRDREGLRSGDHRRRREAHYRHRLRDGLGQAAEARIASARNRSASSAPDRPASRLPSSCARRAIRSACTTVTTGSAVC